VSFTNAEVADPEVRGARPERPAEGERGSVVNPLAEPPRIARRAGSARPCATSHSAPATQSSTSTIPLALEGPAVVTSVASRAAVVDIENRVPRLVNSWSPVAQPLNAADVGPPWDVTINGGSSPSGARNRALWGA
jgi:hypothetical protein